MTDERTELQTPKELLVARGLRAKRHFGQNFLADTRVAAKIAELCVPDPEHAVTEIGAGTGALTAPLLERASRVVAIERDRDLVPILAERFAEAIASGRLVLEEADAKTVDFFHRHEQTEKLVLAGNLPYQLTGPLMRRACSLAGHIVRAVFLVQLEVAERLTASPDTSEYGVLSVFVQSYFDPRRALVVRPGVFYPQPSVDSALVELVPRSSPLARDTPMFRALVKSAFEQRRKTLKNAWRRLPGVDSERLERAAKLAGVALDFRGERLSVEEFSRMAEALETP